MNKVICDICGTAYQETADCCPICGSSREYAVEQEISGIGGMPEYVPISRENGFLASAAEKLRSELYDYEEDGFAESSDESINFQDDSGHQPRHNWFLVILFTVLITLFLAATGYLFFRYYLPAKLIQEPSQTTEETEITDGTTETTETPTIPCISIALTAGAPEINRLGQYWLLHVIVTPEDTTDKLTFVSADESVVTVTPEGRLCAVGEGETTVIISCGNKEIICPVIVRIPETEPTADTAEESETS